MKGWFQRFIGFAAFAGFLAGIGVAQRSWDRRRVAQAETSDGGAQSEAQELGAQLTRLKEELKRMPPESRALVNDILTAREGEQIANPLVMRLSRLSVDKGASLEDQVVAGAQWVASTWRKVEGWLVRLLWTAALGLLALGLAGIMAGRSDWVETSGRLSARVGHYWLLALSSGTVLLVALSGRSPWLGLPLTFYAAPGVMLIGSIFFRLQGAEEADPVLADTFAAAAAPAASIVVGALAGLLTV